MTSRALFVLDLTIVIGLAGLLLSIVAYGKSRIGSMEAAKGRMLPLFIVVALFCGSIVSSYPLKDYPALAIPYHTMNGTLRRVYDFWTDTFRQWENAEGQDVTIDMEDQLGYRLPYLSCVYIDENPEFWVNQAVKKYYGFNSIRGIYHQAGEGIQ